MTKHKISRRDFLAALAAGTVAATACGLHRTFAEASRTFEYWVLNRELSFRRTREGIIYSCEGYPLTDGETSSPGFDNQTLDPAFDWFLGRNFGDPDNGFGLRHILYDTLYDPQLGTNGYGQPVCHFQCAPVLSGGLPEPVPTAAGSGVLSAAPKRLLIRRRPLFYHRAPIRRNEGLGRKFSFAKRQRPVVLLLPRSQLFLGCKRPVQCVRGFGDRHHCRTAGV